jgi:hypothetical protein
MAKESLLVNLLDLLLQSLSSESTLTLKKEAEMANAMAREVSGKTKKETRWEEVTLKQMIKMIRANVLVLEDLTETSNSIRAKMLMVATTLDTKKRASHRNLLLPLEEAREENLIVVKEDQRVLEERRVVVLAPK